MAVGDAYVFPGFLTPVLTLLFFQSHRLLFLPIWRWLVVLGFNATLTAKVISWWSVKHMFFLAFSHQYQHNLSFQSHRLLFSHASAELRGKNTPERKFASTGDQTHNHQVISPTRSTLSHHSGAPICRIFWHFHKI